MNREDFINNYWRYYNILEEDFIALTRYVNICEVNYRTCSDEIIKQYLSVASEFENICKTICGFEKNSRSINIKDLASWCIDNIYDIKSVEIVVKHTDEIKLKPFSTWDKENAWNLFWWKGYNSVKHNRKEKYAHGNLRNLLNTLAALYYMELYLVKEIGNKTNDKDVPNSVSKLFEIVNFTTKDTVIGYELYTSNSEDIEDILSNLKYN